MSFDTFKKSLAQGIYARMMSVKDVMIPFLIKIQVTTMPTLKQDILFPKKTKIKYNVLINLQKSRQSQKASILRHE